LEQYLYVFCNFQADNWAQLLPFMEFAHNAQSHSTTGKSPFEVWYGYQPKFIPPAKFTTVIPTVEEQLHSLDQIQSEVTAALKVAAEIMKCTGPSTPSHQFKPGDLVWLEGTNIPHHTSKGQIGTQTTQTIQGRILHPYKLQTNPAQNLARPPSVS
jgi:hypothetical protein